MGGRTGRPASPIENLNNFPPASILHKKGIAIQRMVSLNTTLFSGEVFDDSVAPLIPDDPKALLAIFAFCQSSDFKEAVRRINHQPKVIPGALTKIPFDLSHWQSIAADKYPDGLPKPYSDDPTQWLFTDIPIVPTSRLHVAVARLLGYRWPRQTGSSFLRLPSRSDPMGWRSSSTEDGIVCLPAVNREQPAAARLRQLLSRRARFVRRTSAYC